MSVIARKLWTEPAYFISAVVGVLQVAQFALPVGGTAHAIITVALTAFGSRQIRGRVSPVKR